MNPLLAIAIVAIAFFFFIIALVFSGSTGNDVWVLRSTLVMLSILTLQYYLAYTLR